MKVPCSHNDKKEAFLHFIREELLYDIKSYCFVEGDVMDRDNEHAKHQVFDVAEQGNIDRVTRMLDVAFAKVVEICYPYSKKEMRNRVGLDDELEEEDEYILKMTLPSSFSETTLNLLEKLIHEYLVYVVVADWMSITKPESKQNWQEKADTTEHEIRTSLNNRVGRVRRPMNPF